MSAGIYIILDHKIPLYNLVTLLKKWNESAFPDLLDFTKEGIKWSLGDIDEDGKIEILCGNDTLRIAFMDYCCVLNLEKWDWDRFSVSKNYRISVHQEIEQFVKELNPHKVLFVPESIYAPEIAYELFLEGLPIEEIIIEAQSALGVEPIGIMENLEITPDQDKNQLWFIYKNE